MSDASSPANVPPPGPSDAPPAPPAVGAGTEGEVLVLPKPVEAELRRHLEAAYPREGCGALLGEVSDGARRVARVEPAENRWPERDDRYLVDPSTLRRLLEEEERGGPRVLGFYHSHPNARPEPSKTDLEHAWPWYHYLIVRVAEGRSGGSRVWELVGDRFVERELRDG